MGSRFYYETEIPAAAQSPPCGDMLQGVWGQKSPLSSVQLFEEFELSGSMSVFAHPHVH